MSRGAQDVYTEIALEVERQDLGDAVTQTVSGCVGPLCGRGPVVCSYPSGAWYAGVAPADAAEIVRDDVRHRRPVERLVALRVGD